MKRILFCCAVAYALGIYVCVINSLNTALVLSLAVLIFGTAVFVFINIRLCAKLIVMCVFMAFGAIYASNSLADENSILLKYKAQTVTVCAKICSFPQKTSSVYSVTARALLLKSGDAEYEINEKTILRLRDKTCTLTPGDIVCINCKVIMPQKSPYISKNTALSLKVKKIYTYLNVKKGNCTLISTENYTLNDRLLVFRKKLTNTFFRYLPEKEASLLSAMLLGDRSAIGAEETELFAASGLSHIIAVSGLHVNLITLTVTLLFAAFRLNKAAASILTVLCLIVYIPLTGLSPSAVRAGIMSVFYILSKPVLREADSLTSLGAAALCLTFINPLYAFSLSFILSFGASLGIILFANMLSAPVCRLFEGKSFNSALTWLISSLSLTLSAQIVTFPVLVLYFKQTTAWVFVTNLICVPLLLPALCGGMALLLFNAILPTLAPVATYFCVTPLKIILLVLHKFGNLTSGMITADFSFTFLAVYVIFWLVVYIIFKYLEKAYFKANCLF